MKLSWIYLSISVIGFLIEIFIFIKEKTNLSVFSWVFLFIGIACFLIEYGAELNKTKVDIRVIKENENGKHH